MYLTTPDPQRISQLLAGRLWARLRLGQVGGFHFSRNHPVGRLVADFFCAEAHLIVQLESARAAACGGSESAVQFQRDGYRVVRVTEYELIDDLEGAVRKIAEALRQVPPEARRKFRYLH